MNLLEDNIRKLFIKYLIPSLGSAMVLSIYTLTDAIVVGKGVGSDALAALSIITPPFCLLVALGILIGVGGSVHMNIQRGLGEERKANNFFTISLLLAACVTICLWVIYATQIDSILRLMGANDSLMGYAKDYMHYVLIFFPVTVFSTFLAIFVRTDNDPNRAMAAVITGGVINIVLDIVTVYPLQFGIGGAALASMCGMLMQILILSGHFLSKKNALRIIRPFDMLPQIRAIVTGGLSGFINELANGIIVLLFNIQFLKYCGNTALSVYSVISNCVILFNSLFTGVGQASQPILSINFGAGKQDRIKVVKKMAFTAAICLGAVFSLIGVLFPHLVCGVFIKETAESAVIAEYGIRLYFITFLPMGINVTASYYLQSLLQSGRSMALSLLRNVILSTILILILPIFLGGEILWIIMPVVELITLVVSLHFLKKY